MTYCREYKEWTNSDVEATFAIKEVSGKLLPTNTNDEFKCDGIGFIGLYKDADGLLLLKMKSDNENGYELVSFPDIKQKYTTNSIF